jgi:hypothetical protein
MAQPFVELVRLGDDQIEAPARITQADAAEDGEVSWTGWAVP